MFVVRNPFETLAAVVIPRRLVCALVLCGLVWGAPSGSAQSVGQSAQPVSRPMLLETDRSERLLDAGRQLLFAFRLGPAEDSLRRLAEQPDGAVAAYHGLAMLALYQGFVTEHDAYYDRFTARADTLLDLLSAQPEGPWRSHLEAEAKLMQALLAGRQGKYIKAAFAARAAYRRFESVTASYPTFADSHFGRGLLHLAIGTLPRSYQRLLGILGFRGDAEKGREEIAYAATHSRYNRSQAEMALALADLVLYQDVPAGRRRLQQLYQGAPESILYAYLYGFALLTNRRADAAADVLQTAVDRAQQPDYFFVDFLDFFLAKARFIQGDYSEAERLFRRYLGRHRGQALQAQAYLHLGLSVEIQGRWAYARPYYDLVQSTREFDSDRAAQRWARARAARPMTPNERQLLLARNAFDGGRYEEAERLLRPLFADTTASADERAEAAYRLGRVWHVQERYDRALAAYRYAVAHPGDAESKWGPWAQFHTGEIYATRGQTEPAIDAYEAALAWDGPYDYHESLEQTARLALVELRRDS